MFSKSYSNKSENDYISVCTTLFDNIENELILYPSKIGIRDYEDLANTNIFSDWYEKTKTRNTTRFFNGVLGAISDEIYDGNRNDYKSFIDACFKNSSPLGGKLIKYFFKDNKSSDQIFQQGRKWGKEFYNRYQNNNLAEIQQSPERQNKKSTKRQAAHVNEKKLANQKKVLEHIKNNQLSEKQKEKQAKIEKFRQERLAKQTGMIVKGKERPLGIRVALWIVVPWTIIIIFLTLAGQSAN
tara:strand:+ start:432 stop:1154 length:723 start_codon:yes stop_codon:yes gene_type:complete